MQERQNSPYLLITFLITQAYGNQSKNVLWLGQGLQQFLFYDDTNSFTYRCEELWGGDGRAVAVQFDSTAQVKITNFHW